MVSYQEISESVVTGNARKVRELVEQALKEEVSPRDILNKGLIPGMAIVGEKFKIGEYFIPEVLVAARAMTAGIKLIEPFLSQEEKGYAGKVVIGTVSGDIHDIGKNLVAMMLKGAGFQVIDLGNNVSPEKFVEKALTESADIIAMSALLTTTMLAMRETVNAVKKAGIRDKVKIMIGGAPVSQKFANEIGADGYAPDATTAVMKAKELLDIS